MAGNTEIIDHIIDPKANKEVADLQAQLELLEKQFVDTARGAISLNNATGGSRSFREYNQNSERAALATERLRQAQNNTARTAIQLQAAQDRLTAAQTRATSATQRALSPYEQLNREHIALRNSARDLGIQFGVESAQFIQAAERANILERQLRAVDTTLGQSQRNVGNYGSAFAGLSRVYGFVRIAANILPGLGISGIFLLAFEGISKLVEATGLFEKKLDNLKQAYKNVNEVSVEGNKQAADQLTNLKYLYEGANDVTQSTKDRTLAAKELKKEFPALFDGINTEAILNGKAADSYDLATKAIIANARAMSARNKIAELAAKQLDLDIERDKVNYKKATDIAAAKAAGDITVGSGRIDPTGKNVNPEGADALLTVKGRIAIAKQNADISNTEIKRKKAEYEEQIKILEDYAGGRKAIQKAIVDNDKSLFKEGKDPKGKTPSQLLDEQLKALKLANDAVQSDQTKSYEERYKSAYEYEQKSGDLILAAENKKVLNQYEASNKAAEVEKDAGEQRKKIQEQINKDVQELEAQMLKNLTAGEKARLEEIKQAQYERLQAIDKERTDYINNLNKQYTDGTISTAQYNKGILSIEQATATKRIEVQLAAAKATLNTELGATIGGFGDPKDLQKAADELVKIQKDADDYITKLQLDNINTLKQARQDLANVEKEAISKSVEAIQSLIDNSYQNQIKALQEQSNQIDENAKSEKQAIDRSLDTASNKASKQLILDAQVSAQKELLAEKEKKIAHEQARIDALIAVGKITATTIQTVLQLEAAAAVATANASAALAIPIFGPAIAAIGFAAAASIQGQIPFIIGAAAASAAAAAIPAFKDGGTTKGGLLLWGERGTELAIEPGGKSYLSPDHATYTTMPAGTKIIPNHELTKPMKMNKPVGASEIGWREVVSAIERNKPKESRAPKVNVFMDGDWYNYSKRVSR
jgi:hypothetical protein